MPRSKPFLSEAKLLRMARAFLKQLKVSKADLDIILLPDKDIAALKRRFIKKQTEPNVLAFPEPAGFPHPDHRGRMYIGEVYLNRDILSRSPERAAPLLLHGILHLLGHDHKKDRDAIRMESLEKKILRK